MEISLYKHQEKTYVDTLQALVVNKKVCVTMPTGSGKSVLIARLAKDLPGRTLILTHRIEILQQNSEWLTNASILASDLNTLKHDAKIVVAMVQTAYARISKFGIKYLGHFDNIILDEVQVLIFEKVFEQYDYNKLIGFTGTPVLEKRIYTTIDGIDYVEPYTLSEIFDVLIQGADTQDLIDQGYLVKDFNIALKLPDFDKLKESDSSPDGYTKKSLNEVYKNTASRDVLTKAYNDYCKGKKTLIFNASTTVNKYVYDHFKSKGINCLVFDTVNNPGINPDTRIKWKREEVIEWFKNEKDAVLINTNVFTTGFNVKDVEVVVVNRATKSLSLWIQMVGRGSRTTDKIFKDKFTVIDLGQNIYNHGIWSMRRNWTDYFTSSGRRRRYVTDMLDTWQCEHCGSLTIRGELFCCECGEEKSSAVINGVGVGKRYKDGELEIVEYMPDPKAKDILKYARYHNEGSAFAFQVLEQRILEMFTHHMVSKDFYVMRHENFKKRIIQIYKPIYSAIIRSELKGGNKKYETQIERMFNKVDKLYNYDN